MQFARSGWFEPYEGDNEGKEVCVKFNENRNIIKLNMCSETDFNIKQIKVPIGSGCIEIQEGLIHFPDFITIEEAQSKCSNNKSLKILVEYNRSSSIKTAWIEKERWDAAVVCNGELTGRARLVSRNAGQQVIPNLPIAEIKIL